MCAVYLPEDATATCAVLAGIRRLEVSRRFVRPPRPDEAQIRVDAVGHVEDHPAPH